MVVRSARAAAAAGLPLLAVLGYDAAAVRAAIADALPATFVLAPDHARGMGATLAAGARAVPPDWTGLLICLADMPWVEAATLAALAAALTGPESAAVPVHAGRRGNPAAFGRAWLPRLAALDGDTGARALLADARVVEVPAGPGILRDADTPAALAPA